MRPTSDGLRAGRGFVDIDGMATAVEVIERTEEWRAGRPTVGEASLVEGAAPAEVGRHRVASITMCYPTASEPWRGRFVQWRLAALTRHADVRVICPRPWFPIVRSDGAAKDAAGAAASEEPRAEVVPMLCVPRLLKSLDGWWFGRAALAALRALRERWPFDLVDAHFEWPDAVGAVWAARRLGVPVVVTLRGKLPGQMGHRIRRRQIAWALAAADARIAVSRSLAGLARELVGRELPIEVIPNGVDRALFHPLDRADARRALPDSGEARWIVSVGHLQRLKGFDLLIEALPAVRAHLGDVRLALVGGPAGEPRYERSLRALVDTLKLGSAVRFLGRVAPGEVNVLLNAADLFALASRSEGGSNALREALAAGVPVVATEVGGNPELVCDAALGRTCAVRADALALAIIDALRQSWDRAAIAAAGGRRTWQDAARETMDVFRRVARAR